MSLKRKATSGSFWTSITRMGINLVDFVVYAYLARVLTLEEFGLAGFCFLFIEFANTLVNAGVNQNLVQRDEWDDRYAASTMTFVAGMALIAVIGIVSIGFPVAYYNHSELAAWVVICLAPLTILTSFQVVVSGKLQRDFKNKEMGIARFSGTTISSIMIFIMAESGFGLWSLVLGKLINAILQYAFMLIVANYKPHFAFNKNDHRELISFCFPLLGMAILNFLHRKASNMFTGLVLGPASFALLAAAQKGESVINQVTMSSINSMVVPSFSRVKDRTQLGEHYVKMVSFTSLLVLPIFMGLAAIATPFITVVFGEKFAPSAIYMTISAFGMFPAIIAWFLPNLLISIGQTRVAFNLTLLNIVSSVFIAGATIWFGIEIMLISIIVGNCLILPIRLLIVNKYIVLPPVGLLKSTLPSVVSSLLMFMSISALNSYLSQILQQQVIILLILIVAGAVCYPLFLLLIFRTYFKSALLEVNALVKKPKVAAN